MKKILALILCLWPSFAWAACTGIFPANTVCGNLTGAPAAPIPFTFGGTLAGPGTTVVGDLALWNNLTGTLLKDQAPGALTTGNDTNVTLSAGGSATTALVNAASITAGWTGTLSSTRGGTGANNSANTGFATWNAGTLGSVGASATILPSANGGTGQSNAAATGFATWSAGTLGSVGASATVLPIANGGTNGATQQAALNNVAPTPTRAGDIIYWNGSNWVNLAGNNSGTQFLQETNVGVPSWATVAGTGTVTSISGVGNVSTGTGGAITTAGTLYGVSNPQGRITLTSATPVLSTNATAQGTLYYDSYAGAFVSYYNGTGDVAEAIASNEVSDVMVSAASAGQVVSGQVYDLWWVHSGANRICLAMSTAAGGGGGWASDTGSPSNTARGTGYSQLDMSTRPYITNKNSITHCMNAANDYGPVSANQATYLGTIYATANGQTSMTFTAAASGGGGNILGVYNPYNQVPIVAYEQDSKASWTIASSTWRKADNSAANSISWVDGLQRSNVIGTYVVGSQALNASSTGLSGCTNDWSSGSPTTAGGAIVTNSTAGVQDNTITTQCPILPQLGLHVLNAVEAGTSGSSVSYFGSNYFSNLTAAQQLSIQLQD